MVTHTYTPCVGADADAAVIVLYIDVTREGIASASAQPLLTLLRNVQIWDTLSSGDIRRCVLYSVRTV